MSWRTGARMFWEILPIIREAIIDPDHRAEFTRGMLKLFLADETDPSDLRGKDTEIDRLLDEIEAEE